MELSKYLDLPYTITLRRDEDGDWIARVQELSGCTAHGSTEAEAIERLKEAKREWLAAALEDQVSIPLPDEPDQLPSGKWVQRAPRSLHKNLARLAKTERTSLNQLVVSVLSEYVGKARRQAPSTRFFHADVAWFSAPNASAISVLKWGNELSQVFRIVANVAREETASEKVS